MASTPPPPNPKTKPTILVVPGAHHNAHHFHHVTHLLHQASYRVLPTTPPYYNGDPQTYKWRDDVDHIRAILEQELEERDVVVVMHSFGGFAGSEAVGEVLAEEGDAGAGEGGKAGVSGEGKGERKGRVLNLVYLTAFLPQIGAEFVWKGEEKLRPLMEVSISLFVRATHVP